MMEDKLMKKLLVSGMLAAEGITLVIAQPPVSPAQAEGKVPPPPPPAEGKAPLPR